jgi:BASS family bile acid:Na+ symporter
MLQGITSPMMAAPALAALVGLDATLVLMALIASTALTPFSAPFFAWLFVGKGLSLAPLALGAKLLAMLAGSALVGGLARRLLGVAVIARRKEEIDGLNILVLFIFVAAVMETVAGRFLAAPLAVLLLVALAFLVFAALFAATALLFAAAGRERALSLGLMVSQRNLGLMVAATGGALPDLVWLWVALCQFPIYLSPQFLRWWLGRAAPARAAATRSARS